MQLEAHVTIQKWHLVAAYFTNGFSVSVTFIHLQFQSFFQSSIKFKFISIAVSVI